MEVKLTYWSAATALSHLVFVVSCVMPLLPVKVRHCANIPLSPSDVLVTIGEETEYSNCSDGDVQLASGQTAVSGRLEVCYSKAWGTVCNYAWGNMDSRVACRQLGFQPYGKDS